ncbi:hypothetical protein [Mycoplasma hafezii]|uniref:hypothetical protein n=1 Tax=Mycoplasma hafezii TaxID=525886 RepID=UPI003CEDAFAF
MTTIQLFQIYKLNQTISNNLILQYQINTSNVLPILIYNNEVYFITVYSLKDSKEDKTNEGLLLYTDYFISDYYSSFKFLFKLYIDEFIKSTTNVHNKIMQQELSELNKYNILQKIKNKIKNNSVHKLIGIKIKHNLNSHSWNYCPN